MKIEIKIALFVIISAVLVFAISSCDTQPDDSPISQCLMAKHVKDSTINAGKLSM